MIEGEAVAYTANLDSWVVKQGTKSLFVKWLIWHGAPALVVNLKLFNHFCAGMAARRRNNRIVSATADPARFFASHRTKEDHPNEECNFHVGGEGDVFHMYIMVLIATSVKSPTYLISSNQTYFDSGQIWIFRCMAGPHESALIAQEN